MTHWTLRKNVLDTAFIAFKSSKCLSLCIILLYCYRNTCILIYKQWACGYSNFLVTKVRLKNLEIPSGSRGNKNYSI